MIIDKTDILSERITQEELRICPRVFEETEALHQRGNESSVTVTKTEKQKK